MGGAYYQTEARMRHGALDGCVKRSKEEGRVRHGEPFLLRRGQIDLSDKARRGALVAPNSFVASGRLVAHDEGHSFRGAR